VTTKEQVLTLLEEGLDIEAAAERLGVPPGLAYLVATGRPADGSETGEERSDEADGGRPLRPGAAPGSIQQLVNPPAVNPTRKEEILVWLRHRAAADAQMRHAADTRPVEPPPVQDAPEHPELTDELTRQHGRIQYLTKQLAAIPGHSQHATRLQVARRKQVADALRPRILAHARAEEAALWPLVRSVLADGQEWQQRSSGLGVPALAQKLAGLDPDTDAFDQVAKELIDASRRHSALCAALFSRLKDAVQEQQLRDLGTQVKGAGEPGRRKTTTKRGGRA